MNSILRSAVMHLTAAVAGNRQGKIVFYHDLFVNEKHYEHATSLSLFVEHCNKAKQIGFEFVSGVPVRDKTLHICFDDGFRGILECRETLRELGVIPTVYVAVDLIGKPGFLNKEEILDLQNEGYNFQSHTWSHEYLPMYNDSELTRELDDSRKWLSDFLQKDVTQICFPRGLFSRKIYDRSLSAGYTQLISSIPGGINEGVMPNVLPRNLVQSYTAGEYGCVIKGALSPFRKHYFSRHYTREEK